MNKLFLIIAGFLFISLAGALSLETSDNSITLSGTEARVFVWVSADGFDKGAFYADTGPLNGFFEDSFVDLHKARGAYMRLSAPDCAKGTYDVLVHANVCSGSDCQPLSKTIRVQVLPRKSCSYTYDIGQAFDYFIEPHGYGSGSSIYSTVYKHSYFDPTNYQVSITGPNDCLQLKSGSTGRVRMELVNQGRASSFDLRLMGDETQLNAIPSINYVSLYQNEAKPVYVDVNPSDLQNGRYSLTLQATTGGTVVGEKSLCVEVENTRKAFLDLPQKVSGTTCDPVVFYGNLQNQGTGLDSFKINSPDFVSVNPSVFSLHADEQARLQFLVNTGGLKAGTTSIPIEMVETIDGKTGTGNVELTLTECKAGTPSTTKPIVSNVTSSLFKYSVIVKNDGNTNLNDVKIRVDGVPSSWEQKSDVISIPAGSSEAVTVLLTRKSDEAAKPVLVVQADGKTLETVPLEEIPANASSISGLFTALNQNSIFIGALVLVALIVIVVLYGSRKSEAETYRERVLGLAEATRPAGAQDVKPPEIH